MYRIGEVIASKYEVLSFIDDGVTASVYKGRVLANGDEVAIKVNDEKDTKAIKKEWNRLKLFDPYHFTPTLFDIGKTPDPYLVFSKEGPSIIEMIKNRMDGRQCSDEVAYILFHTITVLNHMLEKGYCHGDAHVGNFLFSRTPGKAPIIAIDFADGNKATVDMVHHDATIFLESMQKDAGVDHILIDQLLDITRENHELNVYRRMLEFIKNQSFDPNDPSPFLAIRRYSAPDVFLDIRDPGRGGMSK